MNETKSIHEYDEMLKRLDLNVNKLGCVMLPIDQVDLFGEGRSNVMSPAHFYKSSNPEKFWIDGDAASRAHVTLLYGLLTPAYEQKENIDELLATWERPTFLDIDFVDIFPSTDPSEEYGCIVARLWDERLNEANNRLSYLPHVNTFPGYKPHVTLAYVKLAHAELWREVLQASLDELSVKNEPLDYGSNTPNN